MSLPDLSSSLIAEADLARLERCLEAVVTDGDRSLGDIATHLIRAGGKRIRPMLALAAASLNGGPIVNETILGGVSVELVHLASLYHDDVMDEAPKRRNVISVNALWGNHLAIVAGDYLLARSAEIAAKLGNEFAGLIATTLARLCQGQVAEVRAAYQLGRSEEEYLKAISDKTAALMSTACRIGGLTGGLESSQVDALSLYGESLGMVFQIRDDVLDVVADEDLLGKPPGQDLAEGVYTLPVQRAMQDALVGAELRGLLGKPLDHEAVALARHLVSQSSGIEDSYYAAQRYANDAVEATTHLGSGPIPGALATLALNLLEDLEASFEALAS